MQTSGGGTERRVRIQTLNRSIEGHLRLAPRVRTLDDLNTFSRRFMRVHGARIRLGGENCSLDFLVVNKESVLFVLEILDRDPLGKAVVAGTRAPLSLCVRDFVVRGFVHVPPNGDPFRRLDHDKHPFMALTSASISSADEHIAAPFIAVNRTYIDAAHEMDGSDLAQAVLAEHVTTGD